MPRKPRSKRLNSYITGERLQSLADVTVTTKMQRSAHRGVNAFVPPSRQFLLDAPDWNLPALRDAKTLFVYTHLLSHFVEQMLPRLIETIEQPIRLITHNSDSEVGSRWLDLLQLDALEIWFAQNATIDHPKLTPLPIGLANSQWPHGDLRRFHRARSKAAPFELRKEQLFAHFSLTTNSEVRVPVRNALSAAGFSVEVGRSKFSSFLGAMAAHRFVACPRGNGIDTHRVWEALYLGAIPIGATEVARKLGLPCLVLDDWEGVRKTLEESKQVPLTHPLDPSSPLSLQYWTMKIRRPKNIIEHQ